MLQTTALRLSLCLPAPVILPLLAAGKRETLSQPIGSVHNICFGPLSHAIHLRVLPRTTVHAKRELKDLASSQSADDVVPVKVSAESISENDPASRILVFNSG